MLIPRTSLKNHNHEDRIVDSKGLPIWSLIHSLRWSGLIISGNRTIWNKKLHERGALFYPTSSVSSSEITSLTIVYSTVYLGTDERKHQSSASLAFVGKIHRSPVNCPHKGPVTRKIFPFDDVIILWLSMILQCMDRVYHQTYGTTIFFQEHCRLCLLFWPLESEL